MHTDYKGVPDFTVEDSSAEDSTAEDSTAELYLTTTLWRIFFFKMHTLPRNLKNVEF